MRICNPDKALMYRYTQLKNLKTDHEECGVYMMG